MNINIIDVRHPNMQVAGNCIVKLDSNGSFPTLDSVSLLLTVPVTSTWNEPRCDL